MISPFCLVYNENRAWATQVSCNAYHGLSLVTALKPCPRCHKCPNRFFLTCNLHRNPVSSVATVPTASLLRRTSTPVRATLSQVSQLSQHFRLTRHFALKLLSQVSQLSQISYHIPYARIATACLNSGYNLLRPCE